MEILTLKGVSSNFARGLNKSISCLRITDRYIWQERREPHCLVFSCKIALAIAKRYLKISESLVGVAAMPLRVFPGVPFTYTPAFFLSPVIFPLRAEITNVFLHVGCHDWIIPMLGNISQRKAGVFFLRRPID